MGFFNRLFTAGPALNRLAKTCDECLNCISRYKYSSDFDEIIKCAWLYTYGIQNNLEKWNWNPLSTQIFIPNHQELGRVSINQAVMFIVGSISKFADAQGESDLIEDIIEEGESFRKYEYLCSVDLKNKLKP
jgi:hypothetical protein